MRLVPYRQSNNGNFLPSLNGFWDDDFLQPFNQSIGNMGMDVYETDNDIIVQAPVPGIPAENVDVTFEDGVLYIRADYQEPEEEKQKKKNIHRQGRILHFDYATTLPRAVDADDITADVDNGIVTVTAPIAQSARAKKITARSKSKTASNGHKQSKKTTGHMNHAHMQAS